ncbi:MAG TPA: di-heme oxidoredictase family protein [Kofleriaceae bacterium]|nr:di-heme oxidoredictase family protein [Kofleriaceae bacterium]
MRWLVVALVACGGSAEPPPSAIPIDGLSDADRAAFDDGLAEFERIYGDSDGLGPLYVVTACAGCHQDGTRGPGKTTRMVIVNPDGYTPAMDQSALPFGHLVRLGLTAGAHTPVIPPDVPHVKVTTRLGPQLLGRGYMEAIDALEITNQETMQAARTDTIHGRVNRVTFDAIPNPDTTFESYQTGDANLVGRFGLKARQATIDDYIAGAYQGAMGLTSPMQPTELANPDNLSDDLKHGVDLPIDAIDRVAFYVRRVAIPPRQDVAGGAALFDTMLCSVCHVPVMRTRADYPITQLAGRDAPVYTDMLLHDMGIKLADGLGDQSAGSTTWRTPALIGVRFAGAYLHDGRAPTVAAAILAHAGEAAGASLAFSGLPDAQQQTLVGFVEGL